MGYFKRLAALISMIGMSILAASAGSHSIAFAFLLVDFVLLIDFSSESMVKDD